MIPMNQSKINRYKRNYAMARHHAWAGSVLLAILGAIRWFIADTPSQQKDLLFITAGIILIIYILISLFFTYRYRSGLAEQQSINSQPSSSQDINTISQSDLSAKEREKIEKKKAKAETKRLKKLAKAQEKQNKKSS